MICSNFFLFPKSCDVPSSQTLSVQKQQSSACLYGKCKPHTCTPLSHARIHWTENCLELFIVSSTSSQNCYSCVTWLHERTDGTFPGRVRSRHRSKSIWTFNSCHKRQPMRLPDTKRWAMENVHTWTKMAAHQISKFISQSLCHKVNNSLTLINQLTRSVTLRPSMSSTITLPLHSYIPLSPSYTSRAEYPIDVALIAPLQITVLQSCMSLAQRQVAVAFAATIPCPVCHHNERMAVLHT